MNIIPRSNPIDIPNANTHINSKKSTYAKRNSGSCIKFSKQSSPSSSSFSNTPSPSPSPVNYILLEGNGIINNKFNNDETVFSILQNAMKNKSKDTIKSYIDEVNVKGRTYIIVKKDDAAQICRDLVENGLYAKVISKN